MNEARLRRIAVAFIISYVIAAVLVFRADTAGTSMLKSGDFPGFYVQGWIVNHGLGDRLYDPTLQRDLENGFWPSFKGKYYMAVYPPYVAAMLSPLCALHHDKAQLIFTLLMAGFYALTCWRLSTLNPRLRGKTLEIFSFGLLLAPIFCSVFAAQNTALSMFLAVNVISFMKRESKARDFWAGICLGLWLFKPQFPLVIIPLIVLLTRRLFILYGALIPAVAYYVAGVAVLGWRWPTIWIESSARFGDTNYLVNSPQMISIIGFVKSIVLTFGGTQGTPIWTIAGVIGILACIGAVIWMFITAKDRSDSDKVGLAIMLAPLLAPQTLFYDFGILCVPAVIGIRGENAKDGKFFVIAIIYSLVAFWARSYVTLSLFFFLAVAVVARFARNLKLDPASSSAKPLP